MAKSTDPIEAKPAVQPAHTPRRNWGRLYTAGWHLPAVALICLLLGILGGFGGGWLENHHNSSSGLTTTTQNGQKKIVSNESQLITQIAKNLGPSVVSVNVDITNTAATQDALGLFGFTQPEQKQAAGTGIIIASDGIIMTNRHVVPAGTTNVSVTLSDGTELKNVSVLGRTNDNSNLDVAFLKVNDTKGHKLPAAPLGDSSSMLVGDDVVAIGNALGQFQNTVTTGIISGYGRSVQAGDSSGNTSSVENLSDLFQTDAAINEGNSGGPLVNLNGQVIGMNTAVAGNAQNIGFAIPINELKGLVRQVLKKGSFSQPYIGVRYIPLSPDVAIEYGLSVQQGAFVAPSSDASNPSVVPGSPADKSGIQERDIITQVEGQNIDARHSLTGLLGQHLPGDKVQLTLVRDGKTRHVTVTLGTLPSGSNS